MKRLPLFLLCGIILTACDWISITPLTPKDNDLKGQEIDVSEFHVTGSKLFVLNEGGMGSNNATLDFLRLKEGLYITGAFRQMNPGNAAGLGDVGNDIAINRDEVWIVVNNSGLVEVISAKDETEIAAIPVPTPRNIAFDGNYAYVTSWAGAYATGSYDSNGYYTVTDSKNPKGQVYKIDLGTKKVLGSVEVGYQPEGIAYYDGKLYVANSGGISSQLPPDYAYDNTVSIIDTKSFKVTQTVEVQVNLKNVYSDGKGLIYVTTLGNYWDIHSGLYLLQASNPAKSERIPAMDEYAMNVSCSTIVGDTVYCIATDEEFDWSNPHQYYVWSVQFEDFAAGKMKVGVSPKIIQGTPYGLTVLEGNYLILADAGDYFNPGSLKCITLDNWFTLWQVTTGVCPGHFALY